MAAFENQVGPVAVFVCVIFQLLDWFVSAVQAVQSLSPRSKTGVIACLQARICSQFTSLKRALPIPVKAPTINCSRRVFNSFKIQVNG